MTRRPVSLRLPLAMAMVVAAGSTALAGSFATVDRSAVTPVEQYRQEALARIGTSTSVADRAAGEAPASSKGFSLVFSYDFQASSTPKFSAHDQGTDIEF